MYQCSKCGKSVEDGKACSCMFENTNQPGVGAPDITAQTPVQEQPIVDPVAQQPIETQPITEAVAQPIVEPIPQKATPVFEQPQHNNINTYAKNLNNISQGAFSSMKNFFLHPASAVKEAVKNNSFKVGLICMLIYILVLGIIGVVNGVEARLTPYKYQIKYAKEDLEDANKDLEKAKKDLEKNKDDEFYKERVENAKERVEDEKDNIKEIKSERFDQFKKLDTYKAILKTAWNRMFDPLVTLALLIIILFVMGKVFNGNGSFTGLIAGVGLATSIYLISVLVLPLIAKIPHLDIVNYLIPAFNYIFALLVYVAFTSTFDFDTDKSVWAVLTAFAVAMLISGLIGEGVAKASTKAKAEEFGVSVEEYEDAMNMLENYF